ncbi:hypothetical protein DNAM_530 [Pseudomonas phage BroderSalsa]|nr:hypothetical protein DNAM_530 [Pseudomonas phage BroderSalsa]
MNRHPLTEDFRMYFSGTYVLRIADGGEVQAMYVETTDRNGDDTQLSGVTFMGSTYNSKGRVAVDSFSADQMIEFRPVSGYFDIGRGEKEYISFTVNNRTQKKGIDPRCAMANGRGLDLNGKIVAKLFEQSQAMISNPAARDINVTKDGEVHWKGLHVGKTTGGEYTPIEQYKGLEKLVCRLLQNI